MWQSCCTWGVPNTIVAWTAIYAVHCDTSDNLEIIHSCLHFCHVTLKQHQFWILWLWDNSALTDAKSYQDLRRVKCGKIHKTWIIRLFYPLVQKLDKKSINLCAEFDFLSFSLSLIPGSLVIALMSLQSAGWGIRGRGTWVSLWSVSEQWPLNHPGPLDVHPWINKPHCLGFSIAWWNDVTQDWIPNTDMACCGIYISAKHSGGWL